MRKVWRETEYTTAIATDDSEGWTALQLQARTGDTISVVARVVFWDAEGQFYLELHARELPMAVVEELIAEAKATINFS